MKSKNADWALLTEWLIEQNQPMVTITWMKLDEIVGGLPNSATKHYPQWWHGDRANTRAWRRAGYELLTVQRGLTVTLVKINDNLKPQKDHPQPAHTFATRHSDRGQIEHTGVIGLEEIDPRSALIVLPCSRAKLRGGTEKRTVSLSSWTPELLVARTHLRDVAKVDDRQVIPAWRRYQGGFYKNVGSALGEAVALGANIVILTGGYGVVNAAEEIGWYDKMLNPADWPHGVIESALIAEVARVGSTDVVAFAGTSTPYATIIRRTSWDRAGIRRAFLVTADGSDGGALSKVPRDLGVAFGAFWSGSSAGYPAGIQLQELT